MNTTFVIKYTYHYIPESGCPCCSESERTIFIYDNNGYLFFYDYGVDLWAENEEQLREFINDQCPQYNNFTVHDDTVWF